MKPMLKFLAYGSVRVMSKSDDLYRNALVFSASWQNKSQNSGDEIKSPFMHLVLLILMNRLSYSSCLFSKDSSPVQETGIKMEEEIYIQV